MKISSQSSIQILKACIRKNYPIENKLLKFAWKTELIFLSPLTQYKT